MASTTKTKNRFHQWLVGIIHGNDGASIAEFALMLPILVVVMISIFDFATAFNLKQKLNNAAREGARFGANLPTMDLNGAGTPSSVVAIRNVVVAYLQAEGVKDCGIMANGGMPDGSVPLMWSFRSSGSGCPAQDFVLSVERSYSLGTPVGGTPLNMVTTRVSLSYPFAWQFGHVITLLAPGAGFPGVSEIGADAIVPNMD